MAAIEWCLSQEAIVRFWQGGEIRFSLASRLEALRGVSYSQNPKC